MLNGSWTKIKVSGRWGARIEGVASVGDAVTLTRKDGKAADKIVAAIVWAGNGVTLAEVADAPPAAPPAPVNDYPDAYAAYWEDMEDKAGAVTLTVTTSTAPAEEDGGWDEAAEWAAELAFLQSHYDWQE
jgi:hypothetical protein